MSAAAIFSDFQKAFYTKWHSGLQYKLVELDSSISHIKQIVSLFTDRKFKVLVEGEFCTPSKIAAGAPRGSFLAPEV
jgi:hypothetical protein